MDDGLKRVAKMADGSANVSVGLSLYAWPKCHACGQYGRYFDPGYLAAFIVRHQDCEKTEKVT